jgi:hypothetical protein
MGRAGFKVIGLRIKVMEWAVHDSRSRVMVKGHMEWVAGFKVTESRLKFKRNMFNPPATYWQNKPSEKAPKYVQSTC